MRLNVSTLKAIDFAQASIEGWERTLARVTEELEQSRLSFIASNVKGAWFKKDPEYWARYWKGEEGDMWNKAFPPEDKHNTDLEVVTERLENNRKFKRRLERLLEEHVNEVWLEDADKPYVQP